MFEFIFGNSITRKVESKKRIEGEIEVLRKQQKVKAESTVKEYNSKKALTIDSINAQINNYKAQIKNLEQLKKDKEEMYDKEMRVAVDKVINDYDRKIVAKTNKAKKLGYYIDAEQRNIQDVIDPTQPNAPKEPPKKILLESADNTKTKKK